MKVLRSRIQGRRLVVEILLIVGLGIVAVYQWTAPQRAEQALATASLEDLKEAAKRNPKSARTFYFLGLREEQAGNLPAAFEAVSHAAELEGDDEDICLKVSSLTSQIYGDGGAFDLLSVFLKFHPNSARVHLAKAQLYRKNQSHKHAWEEAQAAARCDPRLAEAWYVAGLSANSLNDIPKAEEAIHQALALAPREWRYPLAMGDVLARQNRSQEAIRCYQSAISLAPREGVPYLALGKLQLDLAASPTDIAPARQSLLKCVALQPEIPLAYLLIGRSYVREQRWQEAKGHLERAAGLAPTDPDAPFELARVYRRLGEVAAAEQATRRHQQLRSYQQEKLALRERLVVVKGDARATRLKLARLCAENGDYVEAIQQYRRILALTPGAADAQAELARVETRVSDTTARRLPVAPARTDQETPALLRQADRLFSQHHYREAEQAYIRVLKRDKNSARACQGLGLTLHAEGQQGKALIFLQDAILLDPTLSPAQYVLSETYLALGFPLEARKRMEQVVTREPNNAAYWRLLGAACSDAEPYFARAVDAFRRAVALAPRNVDYRLDLADMLIQTNKTAEAETLYRQTLLMAPANPDVLARLGMLLADEKKDSTRQREAQNLLAQARAVRPNDPYTLYALGRLSLNRGDSKQAVSCLQAAIAHTTQLDTAELWYALSRAYHLQKDDDHADQAMRIARKLREEYQSLRLAEEQAAKDPRDAGLRLKLARFYANRGENAKALDQYQSCLRLDSGNAAARKELVALEDRLNASGKMPSMTAFRLMVAASQRAPDK